MLKYVLSNKLLRQVSLLLSGTLLVQIINFGFMPLVLRIYGPSEFGELGAFNALLMLFFPISALCLPMAVVQGRNRIGSRYIASAAWTVALAFSLIMLCVILACKNQLLHFFAVESIGNMVFLLPLAMLFAARLQISQQLLIKQQQFKPLAQADVLQALVINLAKLLLGLWQSIGAVLVAIASFSYLLHSLFIRFLAGQTLSRWQPFSVVRYGFSRRNYYKLWRTVLRYRAFVVFQTPQALLNAAAQSAPVLVLAATFGSTAAGLYTLAKSVLTLPALLLGRAVGDVFYPHFTQAYYQQRPLVSILAKATLSLAAVGLLPFSVFMLVGPEIFDWVFGSQWQDSGDYARWMALWLYCAFVNTPSVKALMVLNMQHWAIGLNVITLSVRIILLWFVGKATGDSILAIAAFASVGVLHSTIFTTMTLWFSHRCNKGFREESP